MNYNGMAHIKLYEDFACKKELTRGVNDYYALRLKIPTGNSFDYKKTFYIKNVGSHTAYNINVIKKQDTSNKINISNTIQNNTLLSNETQRIVLSSNFSKGEVGSYAYAFDVSYDNIP